MAEKNFDEEPRPEGHTFTLGGRSFRTYPSLSLTVARTPFDENETPIETTLNFIRTLVVKEDRQKWEEMLQDPEVYLEAENLLQVSDWLIAEMRKALGIPETVPEVAEVSSNGAKTSRAKVKKK